MTAKDQNKHLFQASVIWLNDKKGLLTSSEAIGSIQVETPAVFGGKGKPWTPEHLFLGSISSCFMTTFLSFAERFKVPIEGLSCRVTGLVELVNGHFSFTKIDAYPDIYISDERHEKMAKQALQKTHKYCLIGNSVNAELNYHSSVRVMNDLKEA
jgi:peroxiredoxin-like protein